MVIMVEIEKVFCKGIDEFPYLRKRINNELEKQGLTEDDLNFDVSGMHMTEIEQKLGLLDGIDIKSYCKRLCKQYN